MTATRPESCLIPVTSDVQELGVDLRRLGIDDLRLSMRAHNALILNGIKNLDQLLRTPADKLLQMRLIGPRIMAEVCGSVNRLCRDLSTLDDTGDSGDANPRGLQHQPDRQGAAVSVPSLPRGQPARRTTPPPPLPILTQREWDAVQWRFGWGSKHTLRQIAEQLGVTRERARQILLHSVKKLNESIADLDSFFQPVSEALSLSRDARPYPIEPEDAIRSIATSMAAARVDLPAGWDPRKVIVALRALVSASHASVMTTRWPSITYVACALAPPVLAHPTVQRRHSLAAAAVAEAKRNWSYAELIAAVLRDAGGPLHWSVIAERAEALSRRQSFAASSLFNCLCSSKQLFARTAAGSYGLRVWGLEDVDPYSDLIARVLSLSKVPLAREEIEREINKIRPILDSSLTMFLGMHPRFYESADGRFGLREWLAPRHEQTLRTPPQWVEPQSSFGRLQAAAEKGWRVDRWVQGGVGGPPLVAPSDEG